MALHYLSTGIDFSAMSNTGGMQSELLDHYEEGTYTPTITGASSTSGQTYTNNAGQYTKIGVKVFCTHAMDLGTKGTLSGFLRFTGWPYALSYNSATTLAYNINWNLGSGFHLTGWAYNGDVCYLFETNDDTGASNQISTSHASSSNVKNIVSMIYRST